MGDELTAKETCCFNCKNKEICRLVNNMWQPDFKRNLGLATVQDKRTKFFEAVERYLAKVCDYYELEI